MEVLNSIIENLWWSWPFWVVIGGKLGNFIDGINADGTKR